MAFLALIAYLLFVLIRPQEFVVALIGLPLVKISLIVAALFMLADKHKRFDAPQNILLFWLIPVILVSGTFNSSLSSGIDNIVNYLTSIFLPFLIVQNLINTTRKQHIVMLFLVFASLIMVHDGMAQKASSDGFGWSGAGLSQGTRITYLGIFSDPNDLGMFLVMVLPLAIYFALRMSHFLKPLFWVVIGFILYGIYMTNSRGALLGVMSQVALWVYFKFGLIKSMVMGVIILPVALIVMSKFRTISSEEASAEGRLDAWYEGFQLLFWKPILGVGMGNFTDYHYLTAHNSFVLVFSELGLPGYFLWVSFLTVCGLMLMKLWNKGLVTDGGKAIRAPQEELIARTFTYSMLGYLATCFFLSRSYTPMLYIFCAMFVATFYRATGGENNSLKLKFSDFRKVSILVCITSLIVIYMAVRVLL